MKALHAQPGARVLSVTEVARRVRDALETAFPEVWIVGEISNLRRPSSGHAYFSLKDEKSQINAVMFRSASQTLPFRPRDGMEVIVHGRISVYEVRGDLQVYVDWMEPRGLGNMQLALEELKRKLAAEGLFDASRKRPLPAFPRAIGLVTALQGAAVHDMLTVLRQRWPLARVVISPVRVQGKLAGGEIAAGLSTVCRVRDVDVVILGRGGGSIEDLWVFNEERVARAIAACRVPVVSAVGHEVDVTISDLVADCRAPTPTAAASLVVPDHASLIEQLDEALGALSAATARCLRTGADTLRALQGRLRDPRKALQASRRRVDELGERAHRAMTQRLAWAGQRLRGAEEQVHALSPLAVLDRGYAIVRREDGMVVRSTTDVDLRDELSVLLAKGRLRVRVEERES